MSRTIWSVLLLSAGLAAGPIAADAAMYNGRNIDGKWYDGRCVSTTYGSYRCQVKFNGDRATIRLEGSNVQLIGVLEEEVISDPHDILVNDPRRGVNWTIELHNLTR